MVGNPTRYGLEADDLLDGYRTELRYHRDTTWAIPQMWWEMTFGGIGAATYLASAVAGSRPGMAVGYAVACVGKGPLLLLDLGRPERFWRVFSKPNTSWISRGAWGFGIFSAAGAASVVLPTNSALQRAATGAGVATAALMCIYDGLFMNESRSVTSWRERILPIMLAASSATAGLSLGRLFTKRDFGPAVAVAAVTTQAAGVHYLSRLANSDASARLSHRDLVRGRHRRLTLGGAWLAGSVAPLVLGSLAKRSRFGQVLAAAGACFGVYAMRKSILASGVHAPVMPPPGSQP